MTSSYNWQVRWQAKIKVNSADLSILSEQPGAFQGSSFVPNAGVNAKLKADAAKGMAYTMGNTMAQKMLEEGVTDYQLLSLDTAVDDISVVNKEGNFIQGFSWYANITGLTTFAFADQLAGTVAKFLGTVLTAVGVALVENPWIVVLAVTTIIAVVAFVVITSSVTALATGVSTAVETAGRSIGGVVLSTEIWITVLVVIGAAIVGAYLLMKSKLRWPRGGRNAGSSTNI